MPALLAAMWDGCFTGCVVLVVAIIISFIYRHHADRQLIDKAQKHMAGRPRRSPEEFGQSFYPPDMQDVATRVLKVLDDTVKVDLSQVEPADQMETDLKLGSLDSLLMLDLKLRLEREFNVKFDKAIFDRPGEGIDELIRIVAAALKVEEAEKKSP